MMEMSSTLCVYVRVWICGSYADRRVCMDRKAKLWVGMSVCACVVALSRAKRERERKTQKLLQNEAMCA